MFTNFREENDLTNIEKNLFDFGQFKVFVPKKRLHYKLPGYISAEDCSFTC